jgi:hypothetical protein
MEPPGERRFNGEAAAFREQGPDFVDRKSTGFYRNPLWRVR